MVRKDRDTGVVYQLTFIIIIIIVHHERVNTSLSPQGAWVTHLALVAVAAASAMISAMENPNWSNIFPVKMDEFKV